MTEPVVAAKAPAKVTLEAGKDYWWCACGQSKKFAPLHWDRPAEIDRL